VNPPILADGILNLLKRIWYHLSKRRQYQFGLVLVLMMFSVFADIVSLGAVLPFLGVLVDPARVYSHPMISEAAPFFGINSADQMVLPLTVIFVTAALLAGGIRILLYWANTKLSFVIGADLSIEVYRRTLYQPYQKYVARNSSELISGITNKVVGTISVLNSLLILISAIGLITAVTGALISLNPVIALTVAVSFGACYGLTYLQVRNKLISNGERIAHEQTQVIKALQEGLGGMRDVLLDGSQKVYCDTYRNADTPLRAALGSNVFISGCPRFVMEALGMVLISGLAYSLSHRGGGITEALPMLGALALGAQRLLPALQQAYGSWTSMVGAKSHLLETVNFLDQPLPTEVIGPQGVSEDLLFKDAIEFKSVRFRYESEGPWVLDGLSLTIPKGSRVGFVGITGSGKSTSLDLLMGLLHPNEGEILVDGQPLSGGRIRAWQRAIAHVPQSIFLADSTIAENIAFGVSPEVIDLDRVKQAASKAQIADFIESRPEGYSAFVGERGIRLSGGQRQRIGIARALYKQATVLVFDEATSALDGATELSVMKAVEGLSRDLTILLIAHRLTTVQGCDNILELESGKVVAQGTYEQLCQNSPSFRKMFKVAEK